MPYADNEKNKERLRKRFQERKEIDRDMRRAALAKWENEHREQKNARSRAYKKTAKYKAWALANKDKRREQARIWAHTPAGIACRKRNQKKSNQRLYEKGREFYIEFNLFKLPARRIAIVQKWKKCEGLCYICGESVGLNEFHIDHVLPRAHGGVNEIENLMPVHRLCNIRKRHHLDYPIKRLDLVALVSDIKSIPRKVMRERRKNGTFLPYPYDPSIAA